MTLRSACLTDTFFGKKPYFGSWDYPPEVPDYQGFRITGRRINEILLYIKNNQYVFSI